MEVANRFDECMDGNVWAAIVGNSIELEAANSEGS
jgi:hypothetical protein